MKRNFIKDWEKDFIILVYVDFDIKEIAKILKRTPSSIQTLANDLKLKKNRDKVSIGDKFGELSIIDNHIKRWGKKHWKCRCTCGKICCPTTSSLLNGKSKSCGHVRLEIIKNGYKDITGTWFNCLKNNAKKRKLKLDLTKEYLQSLLEQQNFKCAITGIPITISKRRYCKEYHLETTASLDRIDSSKGYIEGNVQFLYKDINMMKSFHNQEYFIFLCKKVVENYK
jgi:hypothetical protein